MGSGGFHNTCFAALIHQTRFLGLNLHVGCSVDQPLHQFPFVIAGDPSCPSLVPVEEGGFDACSGTFIDRWAMGHLVSDVSSSSSTGFNLWAYGM
ncbi:hypothetical protein Bca4012_049257 [Brassica carinata]